MSVTTAPPAGDGAADAPAPATARGGRVSALVAVAAAVAGLLVAPPWRNPSEVPAGFVGRLVAGDLERQQDDRWASVAVGDLVPVGASVRSSDGAQLDVRGGRLSLGDDTRAVLDEALVLEVGALLVEVPTRQRSVRVGELEASGRGAWRVDARGGRRVGVYDGGVDVQPAGQSASGLAVEGLQEAPILGGQLPARALPLRYVASDPWDARLLGHLLAVDRVAAQLHRSFVARFGVAPQPRSFYASFAFIDGDLATQLDHFGVARGSRGLGPPADVLLGALVVDLLRDRVGLQAATAAGQVTGLRADGATWGIILARQGLDASDLRDAVDLGLRAAPTSAPGQGPLGLPRPTGPTVSEPSPAGGRGGGARATTPDAGGDRRQPEVNPSPAPRPSPTPTDTPAPGPCQLEPCQPINDGADGLTDLLDETAPGEPGGTLDQLVEEVPTLLPPAPLPRAPISLSGG